MMMRKNPRQKPNVLEMQRHDSQDALGSDQLQYTYRC